MRDAATPDRQLTTFLLCILSALALCMVLYVRIRLLAAPLERDEGEYAYMGQLLLKGINPFTRAYSMKPPGVSVMYGFFMLIFGQSATAIHLGLLLANLFSTFFIFLLSKRLFNLKAALIAAASYGTLSLSQSVIGIFAHATHFVVLFTLAGFLLLLRATEAKQTSLFFSGGLCLGLAFTMKQHAAFFIIFALLYIVSNSRTDHSIENKTVVKDSFLFMLGAIIPYTLIIIAMIQSAVFSRFWLWTVLYAREYVTEITFSRGLQELARQFTGMISSQLPLWLLALSGLYLVSTRTAHKRNYRFFIIGFLFCSFLATCPGLYFREHYFVMLLPAIALLTGAAVYHGAPLLASALPPGRFPQAATCLCIASLAYGMVYERDYLFRLSPLEVSRTIYKSSPFPEALQIAAYLKNNTVATDTIAVMGSEAEIYFYADRLSATGHIYMYSLMENHPYARQMQLEMIREIESAQPEYVVMVKINSSWGGKPDSDLLLLRWAERFLQEQYEQAGVIDILGHSKTRYLWGVETKGYTPASTKYITVHKRKPTDKP